MRYNGNTMNKTNIIRSVIVLALVSALGWYALSRPAAASPGEAVATVNGEALTRAQLTAEESLFASQQGLSATSTAAQAQFQSGALDALVSQALLAQAARQAGVTASSTLVDEQLASAKSSFSSTAEYEKALAARGMTEQDLRSQISENLIVNAYLGQQLRLASTTATDAEVQSLYAQLAAGQSGTTTPPLSQVRSQVEQMVIRQKQQASVAALVAQLRSKADIRILIATSTAATN